MEEKGEQRKKGGPFRLHKSEKITMLVMVVAVVSGDEDGICGAKKTSDLPF
jgi:hypothetical protein